MTKHDRQSFLGAKSEQNLKRAKVGIIGLGGGGSHVVQQLTHLGVGNYILVDPDMIWSASTILTARRQLSWPVEAGNEFECLRG
jgi:molybdopterin-synthase adenylyltransferase